jgi:hypothetical protein
MMRIAIALAAFFAIGPAMADGVYGVQRMDVPPLNMAWQCNDIRVTIIEGPQGVMYDLGGSIWGGSRFFFARDGALFFNGRPCLLLAPQVVYR